MRGAFTFFFLVAAVACGENVHPMIDAGPPDAGPIDAGMPDAGPMCTENIRDPYSGTAPCSTGTRDCAAACTTIECATDCAFADPNPACIGCFDANQISCWNRNGCQDEWNCLSQCIQAHCLTATDFNACVGDNCGVEDQTYADCFEPLRVMCAERTVACLPE